jgi:hypothetical protein
VRPGAEKLLNSWRILPKLLDFLKNEKFPRFTVTLILAELACLILHSSVVSRVNACATISCSSVGCFSRTSSSALRKALCLGRPPGLPLTPLGPGFKFSLRPSLNCSYPALDTLK